MFKFFGLRIKGSGLGLGPGLAATISKIGYLLLQSRDVAKISLKQLYTLVQHTYFLFLLTPHSFS